MANKDSLSEITELCGGPKNIKTVKENGKVLNITIKDRSLVQLKDLEQLVDVKLAQLKNSRLKVTFINHDMEEKKMAKAKKSYTNIAQTIVENVGGQENVLGMRHCITRVRFRLRDEAIANDDVLNNTDGIISVVKAGGEYMVVIGNEVGEVYEAVSKQLGLTDDGAVVSEDKSEKKVNPLVRVLNTIVGSISPALNFICAGGVLKGLLTVLTMTGVLAETSGLYMLMNAMGDAVFYFLPVILDYNLARHLGGEPFLGLVIGAILCYPTVNAVDIPLFGQVVNATYTSSFLPVVAITAVAVPLSKFLKRYIPTAVEGFLVPVITLLIVIPLGFLIIGPAVTAVGGAVNSGITFLLNTVPLIAGVVFSGAYQIMVLFGVHSAMTSFSFMNVLAGNPDQIMALAMFPSFAQIGVVLAVYLKTKDKKLKSIALPAFISGIFGVTEPAIYGVTLPRIKMFVISCIGAMTSAIVVMLSETTMYNFTGMGVVALLGMVSPENPNFFYPILAAVVPFVVSFIIAFVVFKDKEAEAK